MTGLGYPKISDFYLKHKTRADAELMFTLLQRARTEAIRRQGNITVCPSIDLVKCEDDWQLSVIVFNDHNKNQRIEFNEELISVLKASEYMSVNRPHLSFSPFFQASSTTATLSFCLKNKIGIRALVISNVGRVRVETDRQKIKCQS